MGTPVIVFCMVDDLIAAERHLRRGLENPERHLYHGDNRVVHYKKAGEFLLPASYEAPDLDVPTIRVSNDEGCSPGIDEIVKRFRSLESQEVKKNRVVSEDREDIEHH